MFKSTGLAKMFAGHRKFFRGPHVRHLCSRASVALTGDKNEVIKSEIIVSCRIFPIFSSLIGETKNTELIKVLLFYGTFNRFLVHKSPHPLLFC